MVNVGGTSCACGGTHVKNTNVIGGVTVTKIKKASVCCAWVSQSSYHWWLQRGIFTWAENKTVR